MSDHRARDAEGYPSAPPTTVPPWGSQPGPPPVVEPPSYGSGPPLPPIPPATPVSGRRTAIVVGSVGAVLVLAIGLVWFLRSDRGQVTAAGSGSTTSTTRATSSTSSPPTTAPGRTPGGTTPPGTTPNGSAVPRPAACDLSTGPATTAEILSAVRDVGRFVEQRRGLVFRGELKVVVATEADFKARLLADFDAGQPRLERTGRMLQSLGLVNSATALVASLRASVDVGVISRYDSRTGELVVLQTKLTPYARQTLARELTEALDNQYFDVVRPSYETAKDEVVFGLAAVVQGDAARLAAAYFDAMMPSEQAQQRREVTECGRDEIGGIPIVLAKWLKAPATVGRPFVDQVLADGGERQLIEAFRNPPHSSAEVVHSDRYFSRDVAVDVAKPRADGKETDEAVFGELLTQYVLEDSLDPATAQRAAAGWAGDRYVVWDAEGSGVCIRINYKMQTARELTELRQAFAQWAENHPAAQVRPIGADLLEVTSCSNLSGGGTSPA